MYVVSGRKGVSNKTLSAIVSRADTFATSADKLAKPVSLDALDSPKRQFRKSASVAKPEGLTEALERDIL
jgi:hypothetical protein